MILAVPNVAHWSVRLCLLRGKSSTNHSESWTPPPEVVHRRKYPITANLRGLQSHRIPGHNGSGTPGQSVLGTFPLAKREAESERSAIGLQSLAYALWRSTRSEGPDAMNQSIVRLIPTKLRPLAGRVYRYLDTWNITLASGYGWRDPLFPPHWLHSVSRAPLDLKDLKRLE